MRVPLEWLKEYVTIRLSPEKLAQQLTMAGLEVVALEQVGGGTVFDLEITPNRADWLSVIGVAREVAAITGQRLKPSAAHSTQHTAHRPSARSRTVNLESRTKLTIRIEDRKGCTRYVGRVIEGVQIAPSPEWMQRRLTACGVRPINNVVDVTNYVLLECGQPLHAFDFSRLAQGTIIVRRAKTNEPIVTLDGVRRLLSSEMLVIADAQQPVAVAGIMGGTGSEVTPQTSSILLESALFNPVTVRRTARTLGLTSESSYRFERGVDPQGVSAASERAATLICELAGGIERALYDVGTKSSPRAMITLDTNRATRWLGISIPPTTMRTTLARLSCRVASSGAGRTLQVIVPSFRLDVRQEVDLYEELARVIGYERFPAHLPSSSIVSTASETSAQYWRMQSLRCVCASLGLTETINWSLISEAELSRCGSALSQAVRLVNPLSQDHAYLRPSLLMGLLQTTRRNMTQGALGVRIFELGSVTQPTERKEALSLGIALSGVWVRDWRTKESCDLFRLSGIIHAFVARLCEGAVELVSEPHPWTESTQSASIMLNGRPIGIMGQVSRAITQALDVEDEVWVAELSVESLLAAKRLPAVIIAPSSFPPVKRDLSVVIDEHTPFTLVDRAIREVGGALTDRVELIDRYTGQQVPSGKYSLTFSIEYRDPSRTLTAAEVDTLHQRIGQTLVSRFGATLR